MRNVLCANNCNLFWKELFFFGDFLSADRDDFKNISNLLRIDVKR